MDETLFYDRELPPLDQANALMYQLCHSVSRYLRANSPAREGLMYDEIPWGTYPRYDAGTGTIFPVYLSGKKDNTCGIEGCTFSVRLSEDDTPDATELHLRAFEYATRYRPSRTEEGTVKSSLEVARAFLKYESDVFFELLSRSAGDQKVYVPDMDSDSAAMNAAFRMIEQHDCVAAKLMMNEKTAARLARNRDLNSVMYNRTLYTANVLLYEHPKLEDRIFVLTEKECVGVVAHRTDVQCTWTTFPDGKWDTAAGVPVWYEIGMAVINPHLVSSVEFLDHDSKDARERLPHDVPEAEISVCLR